jgi:hypothetical protein
MGAGKYNLVIRQGETLGRTLTWKPGGVTSNLTGYTARLKARIAIDSTDTFINLTTENGGITLGGAAGTVTLNMTAAATAALTAQLGVYDLELISGSGDVRCILEGNVIISREVTT